MLEQDRENMQLMKEQIASLNAHMSELRKEFEFLRDFNHGIHTAYKAVRCRMFVVYKRDIRVCR